MSEMTSVLPEEWDMQEYNFGALDPMPEGYAVIQMDSGHYMWMNKEEQEGPLCVDPYWCRRCAFAHHEKHSQQRAT